MGFKKNTTTNRVALVTLQRLPAALMAQCHDLRAEAGRLWSDLVAWHAESLAGGHGGLDDPTIRERTKGGRYALHSQSIQALGDQFLANVKTAQELRAQQIAAGQPPTTNDPCHPKPFQTVRWKGQAIRIEGTRLVLPNGRGQPDLRLRIPRRYRRRRVRIVQVALVWRADHYQLALTLEDTPDPPLQDGAARYAGVDLGEVNAAAVVTEDGDALVISGRKLRSAKRLRNKEHAALQQRLARCTKGSRRWKRLMRRKAQRSARLYRQQRDLLHQVARLIITFALQHGITVLAIGDVRMIQQGVKLGANSQKIAQWPHGQLQRYIEEKARRVGIGTFLEDEQDTTRTCAACGKVHARALRGRRMRCARCGVSMNRDANGGANIASRAKRGELATIRVRSTRYRRPVRHRPRRAGVVPPTLASGSPSAGVAALPPGG